MTTSNPAALIELAIGKIKLSEWPDAERAEAFGYIKAMRDLGYISDARWLSLETRAYLVCQERRAELRKAKNESLLRTG